MRKLMFIIILFIAGLAKGQTDYNYNNLPDSIKKDAQYIIWEDKMELEIIGEGKAVEKAKFAVCIASQSTDDFNSFRVPYRKGESVNKFEATIYDAIGKQVKKLKNNEIRDVSAVSDAALFQDDRFKSASFTHNEYPYTLVFEYEKKIEGLLNYPTNYFHSHSKSFVLEASYQIIVPAGFKFKYKEFNLKNPVSKSTGNGKDIYRWNETNISVEQDHDLMPHYKYYSKILELAPVKFVEGEYPGSLANWEEMGLWINTLNNGRDQLSEESKKKILELIKDAKTDKEKVKILYSYLQSKTHYILIALGIGGYQPFSADYVDTKGYGDCKALSNYMQTLLKVAKIKSYYTLINAGRSEDDILTDFPSSQFNHVILCVPQQNDTIWLECTSQKQPFNFLGSFTDDRHALLMTEDGGRLVKTPKYPKELNTEIRNASIEVDDNGNAKATLKTVFKGLQYENRDGINEKSQKDQYDFLKSVYLVSGLEIKTSQFIENKDEIPSIIEKLDLNMPMFASISSKRMFVKLNQFSQAVNVPKNEERKIPFQLRYEFIDIDTVNIRIPDDYTLESMPKPVDLQTKFGSYSFSVSQNGNVYTCVRKYSNEKNTYDAADYKAYYDYKKQVSVVDKAKLVFVKKQ
jgi:hypothetical protein